MRPLLLVKLAVGIGGGVGGIGGRGGLRGRSGRGAAVAPVASVVLLLAVVGLLLSQLLLAPALLGQLSLALLLGLARLLQLLGNDAVNLSVDLGLLTLLLGDELLHGLLLLLQLGHHALLLGLTGLHLLLLPAALGQECVQLAARLAQLAQLLSHLLAFLLHGLALRLLIGGVLVHEAHAAVHLVEVLGAEHEHGLVAGVAVAIHVAQRLDVVLAPLLKLGLQLGELRVEHRNVGVEGIHLEVEAVDDHFVVVDVAAQCLHVLHALLHLLLQLSLALLVGLALLAQLLLAVLQLLLLRRAALGLTVAPLCWHGQTEAA